MEMERVKQFYQIVLLDEYYNLTAEEFERFQKECSEIAAFKSHGATGCTNCEHQDHDTKEFDHVADEPEILAEIHQDGISIDGREYLIETKSAHKAIQAEAQQGRVIEAELDQMIKDTPNPGITTVGEITVIDPVQTAIDADAIKKKFEQLPEKKSKKKAAGEKVPAEKKGYTGKDLTKYVRMHEAGDPMDAIKNTMLKDDFCPQSTLSYYIKKILAKSSKVTVIQREDITDDERIERLKAENKAKTKERQKP